MMGRPFKDPNGDLRAPNVMDNLIYRPRNPGDAGRVHQPGPAHRNSLKPQRRNGATTHRTGPTEYNTPDDRYAARDHGGADAGAL